MSAAGLRRLEDLATGGFGDQPWAERALCAQTDPEAFFPEKGGSTREAKAVCARCDVREECLEWALACESGELGVATSYPSGIFGGLSQKQRQKLVRARVAGGGRPAVVVVGPPAASQPEPVSRGKYVSATGHIALPMATDTGIRPAHRPQKPRPTGLDWSQHRAHDAPEAEPVTLRCRWCRTPNLELVDEVCPGCRTEAEQQFTVPAPAPAAVPAPPSVRHAATKPAPELEPDVDVPSRVAPSEAAVEASEPLVETSEADVAEPVPLHAVGAPSVHAEFDALLDDLAQIRATLTTELARVERALEAVRRALAPPAPVAAASLTPAVATGPVFEPFQRPRRSAQRPRRASHPLDLAVVVRRYVDAGDTIPAIAADLGHSTGIVRRALKDAGARMRDDRAGHSGSTPKDYPPQLVDDVRRLYLDERLSKTQVADRLDSTPKIVDSVMRRHGIAARQGESGHLDGAAPLKARIAALGVPSHTIKTWALEQGLIATIKRGVVPAALVDAYELGHPDTGVAS